MAEQELLLVIESGLEKGPPLAPEPPKGAPAARLKDIDRNQDYWGAVSIENLIPADHVARAIWEVTGKLDLSGFLKDNKSVEGKQGRERWDPRLLASVWVYAYSRGIGAAREIERQMEYEPGLRWLTGNGKVNYHSLSDFRVDHGEAVEKLFCELLGMLSREGLVDLSEVTQDGTKIRAVAGGSSQRREKTLQEHIREAEQAVEKLSQADEAERVLSRKEAAQKRAAEERKAGLEQAVKELEEIRKSPSKRKKGEEARVSESEPEARVMKDGQGGYGLSYNVQTTTETKYGMLVGVGITQQGNDYYQLQPAVERMEKQAGQKPARMIVDGGYITDNNIEAMVEKQVELVGPESSQEERRERNEQQSLAQAGIAKEFGQQFFVIIEDGKAVRCAAGKRMGRQRKAKNYTEYQASRKDCEGCVNRAQCCPKSGARIIKIRKEKTAVKAYQERMREEATKAIYRQRGPVAEFPHAWIKEKLGLRKFHVRGLIKAGIEVLWAAVTYDIQQWVRLRFRQCVVAVAAAA
jgi:transposase